MKKDPQNVDAIANMLVLQVISGHDDAEYIEYVASLLGSVRSCNANCDRSLKKADPKHRLLTDLEEKSALFDEAAKKYRAKVSS